MIQQKEPVEKPIQLMDKRQLELAIELVKSTFEEKLAEALNLMKVQAPIILAVKSGLNDNLSGTEKPVAVNVKGLASGSAEVVQSLAKWKRQRLKELNIPYEYGLYTDMKALRQDEDLSPVHSVYVEQWDWEKHIDKKSRSISYLKSQVQKIYKALMETEELVSSVYPELKRALPEKIHFIHSEDLLIRFPELSSKEREDLIVKSYGAVFIIGIGGVIGTKGEIHDVRAPDYDDWSSPSYDRYKGLNGDLLVWNSELNQAMELSSMGIRVDKASLAVQLAIADELQREQFPFHQAVFNNDLPLSIGGGIGQSRVVMFLLKKSHIGEIQHGIWPQQRDESFNSNGSSHLEIDFL